MPDAVTGPVVRMCGNPDCHGWQSCPDANPLMGLADNFAPDVSDARAVAVFAQNLALSAPKDSAGTGRVVPDGAQFLLHKNFLADLASGKYAWTAVYAGPEATIDEALAGAPEYEASTGLVHDRLRRMNEAGVFNAALAGQAPDA
jgi:hypothetical protein